MTQTVLELDQKIKSLPEEDFIVLWQLINQTAALTLLSKRRQNVSLNGDDFGSDNEYLSQIPGMFDRIDSASNENWDDCIPYVEGEEW